MKGNLGARLAGMFRDDRFLRIPLALFFGYMAFGQGRRLLRLLAEDLAPEISSKTLSVLAAGSNLLFIILLFSLTLVRNLPNKSVAGIAPKFFGFYGSFSPLILSALPRGSLPDPIIVLSIILVLVGAALSLATVIWLGRSFSVLAQSRRLVTTGPYAIVRHPLYICEQILVIGILLDHFSWLAVLVVASQWTCQLQRIKYEERILAETFPEYEAYRLRTPALIPSLR